MMELSWPQVIVIGFFFVAVCFIGWCFFKYGGDTTTYYYRQENDEENKYPQVLDKRPMTYYNKCQEVK